MSNSLENAHNSVLGVQNYLIDTTTLKELLAKKYWPNTEKDVHVFISHCEWCQLGKGNKPSRQYFLSGWRHNEELYQIFMDLIGPISQGQAGHA